MLAGAAEHAAVPIAMALRRATEEDPRWSGPGEEASPRLIIVVDQLEEIFTLGTLTDEQRQRFVRACPALARSGHVWVIATMRSDFYHRCAELPDLVALKEGDGQYDLLPPSFDEIAQIIAYPAQAAGLRFECDPASAPAGCRAARGGSAGARVAAVVVVRPRRVVPSADRSGGADGPRLRGAGRFGRGGRAGAEAVYEAQSQESQAALRPLIRGLATVEGVMADVVVARRVPIEQVARSTSSRAVLDAMVAARLLATDRAEDGTPVVRAAHEVLLTGWPRIAAWLVEDREFLRVRSRVAEQAARWKVDGCSVNLLLPAGKPLAEAEALAADRAQELEPNVIEYIAASSTFHRRRRRRLAIMAALLAAVVTAIGLLSYKGWDDGRKARVFADRDKKAAERGTRLAVSWKPRI